jgi:hypothetical protein
MHLRSKTDPENAKLADILDRILDKGIVLEPWARIVSGRVDLSTADNRIVVAPERRRKIFVVPSRKLRQCEPASDPS